MDTTNSLISCNEDRISKLPETLIHHILSFIDMEFAVQTSVLSKRWRYIWTSLPYLNFNATTFLGRYNPYDKENQDIRYSKFVEMVLILHDCPDLKRFLLVWDIDESDVTARRVNTWILGALRRNVQDLHVGIYGVKLTSYPVPQCLFNCKSLTKLKLRAEGWERPNISVPKSIDLPRLKSLKLYGISIDEINKLISNCPVLESLSVSNSYIATDESMNINIDSVKLKHFGTSRYIEMIINSYIATDESMNINICSSSYDMENCVIYYASCIRLYAPNLTSFVCKDYLSNDYSLENLSSLVSADIEMRVPVGEVYEGPEDEGHIVLSAEDKEVYTNRMMKFLRALHNVKDLKLSSEFYKVISGAPHLLDCQPPQFCNLQRLDLVSLCSTACFSAVTYLLKISPNLEYLSFRIPKEEDDWQTELLLPCMLDHLKCIEFSVVEGSVGELKFLEFFLKNTMVLEELVIHCGSPYYSDRVKQWRQFNKKLQTIPRASSIRAVYVIQH